MDLTSTAACPKIGVRQPRGSNRLPRRSQVEGPKKEPKHLAIVVINLAHADLDALGCAMYCGEWGWPDERIVVLGAIMPDWPDLLILTPRRTPHSETWVERRSSSIYYVYPSKAPCDYKKANIVIDRSETQRRNEMSKENSTYFGKVPERPESMLHPSAKHSH